MQSGRKPLLIIPQWYNLPANFSENILQNYFKISSVPKNLLLMFYPEANAIIRAVIDSRSGTPAFKRVPVLVRAREDRLGPEG